MGITLTEAAATRVKNFLTKRGKGLGLRVGVKKNGCSGWAWPITWNPPSARRASVPR